MDTNNSISKSGLPLLPSPENCTITSNNSPTPATDHQPQSNTEKASTVQSRQTRQKEAIIEQLKKMPIVHNCCEKVGVGRATHYRWMKEDKEYQVNVTEAILEGKKFMNDMAENNLLSLVRDQSFPAISFWLKNNHPDYKNRLEVTGKIATENTLPTPEQKQAIEEALRLASSDSTNSYPLTQQPDETHTKGTDGQNPE